MPEPALIGYLKEKNALYSGKLIELRAQATHWLNYTVQTFPHYTSHAIDHSEEIILQISHLLFENNDPKRPVIRLNDIEVYMLCVAAYLHDAGMVVSDLEKMELLGSEKWLRWLDRTPAAFEIFQKTEQIRVRVDTNASLNNFIADVNLRRLIAEYFRQNHHERSANWVQLNQSQAGRFALDDDALTRTISAICRGHGLARRDLDDETDFPLNRQILGENANVRLLAILLRLGDLLDLRNQRACLLARQAASPLPADSVGHWSQFGAIRQQSITSGRIQLVAECSNADQHRILADWFKWIEDEVANASSLLARSSLHSEWRPPVAVGGDDLIVRPAPGAKYKPVSWKFDISLDDVLTRLSTDVYSDAAAFVRELIQNSLDATRCRIFPDHTDTKMRNNPALLPDEILEQFPIDVSVHEKTDEAGATFQVVRISDRGIGMSEETIAKHFLQIGRSYYQTEEFKRSFQFSPNSKFGIGFLSVFGVSDHVTVETKCSKDADGLKLTLTGPRNYLVVEKSSRTEIGTEITVLLRPTIEFKPGQLAEYLSDICAGVEIPISLFDFGTSSVIRRETSLPEPFEVPDIEDADCKYYLRHFPFKEDQGIFDFYVVAHANSVRPERWTRGSFYRYTYANKFPQAKYVEMPRGAITVSGIASARQSFSQSDYRWSAVEYIDIRDGSVSYGLGRTNLSADRSTASKAMGKRVSLWLSVLERHLQEWSDVPDEDRWQYLQSLSECFELDIEFWSSVPKSLCWYRGGAPNYDSIANFARIDSFDVLIHHDEGASHLWSTVPRDRGGDAKRLMQSVKGNAGIFHEMQQHWGRITAGALRDNFTPLAIEKISEHWSLVKFSRVDKVAATFSRFFKRRSTEVWFVTVDAEKTAMKALRPFKIDDRCAFVLLRAGSGMADLVPRLFDCLIDNPLLETRAQRFLELLGDLSEYGRVPDLDNFIAGWNQISDLPPNLKVPLPLLGEEGLSG